MILYECAEYNAKPLAMNFQASLDDSTLPNDWRKQQSVESTKKVLSITLETKANFINVSAT
jgi:hypothetical protein